MEGKVSHKLQASAGNAPGFWGDGDSAWGSDIQVEQSRRGLEQLVVHCVCGKQAETVVL
jgi:hypothetical protein